MFSVIIVCAGKSTRMQGINKQFLILEEIPIIIRSAMAFDIIDDVIEIIIVASQDNIEDTEILFSQYKFNKNIKFTVGGNTRQRSVFNGIDNICEGADYIAVHDGARPLISTDIIKNVFENAIKYKASTVGVAVKDTIKIVNKGFIESTPPRDKLYITQTPQAFEKKLYLSAMCNAIKNKAEYTDDCQLIESFGKKVFMTDGKYSNIKITTPEDIDFAKNIIRKCSNENRSGI